MDAHLKHIIPPLVAAYTEHLYQIDQRTAKSGTVTLSNAVCQILYTLCKVRGEKVVVGFLSNEPRHLESILAVFERGTTPPDASGDATAQQPFVWQERYIVLLWLSHLMLAPFDLATISSDQAANADSLDTVPDLPSGLPSSVTRIIPICIKHLGSANRERDAASNLLAKLCLRPDMQKIGLLRPLVLWILSRLTNKRNESLDIHQYLGCLSFLSRLVSSGNTSEIGAFIPVIYKSCESIVSYESSTFVKSSAVARKFVIKIFRSIMLHCLQSGEPLNAMDVVATLEEVIEFLLASLSDGDTPVRYAASKALSVIALKLEPQMAMEVVEAILGCLDEDVLWEGTSRDLTAVNALRWHGLTLTLAHLLYRRAPPTTQLPAILSALLLALSFEQRSATGGSIGTNVRDAACFGIWAVSRRYTTKELTAIDTASIRAVGQTTDKHSVTQMLAIELLVAACLDPAGNIRRGSSAALQELIGRHPDTVHAGIPLVQIVDYHAVGLRDRAMNGVGNHAAQLHDMYWRALFEGLLTWKGVSAPDVPSRLSAADAVGRLAMSRPFAMVQHMIERVRLRVQTLASRDVEERHGLLLSMASLVRACRARLSPTSSSLRVGPAEAATVADCWAFLDGGLKLNEKHFTSAALRPELTAASICSLISAMADITREIPVSDRSINSTDTHVYRTIRFLNLCLNRTEESVLTVIPQAAKRMAYLLPDDQRKELARSWLAGLGQNTSRTGSRGTGHAVALGAIYTILPEDADERTSIRTVLTSLCTTAVEVDMRVIALHSLTFTFEAVAKASDSSSMLARKHMAETLLTGLNDYTINERGDVGSLVRLEALDAVECAWSFSLITDPQDREELNAAVIRLSVERLDKVRTRAAQCLQYGIQRGLLKHVSLHPLTPRYPNLLPSFDIDTSPGISSCAYFAGTLELLDSDYRAALLEGYISSAGAGNESVLRASRQALADKLDTLPVDGDGVSLLAFSNTLIELFKAALGTDRLLLPLLEVSAFLLDMQILQRLAGSTFKYARASTKPSAPPAPGSTVADSSLRYRALLSLVQRSHYKSNSIHKLHAALDVYRGLAAVAAVRADALAKVTSMLLHPFPKVRRPAPPRPGSAIKVQRAARTRARGLTAHGVPPHRRSGSRPQRRCSRPPPTRR